MDHVAYGTLSLSNFSLNKTWWSKLANVIFSNMLKLPSNMGIVFEYFWLEADSEFEVYDSYNDLKLLYDQIILVYMIVLGVCSILIFF